MNQPIIRTDPHIPMTWKEWKAEGFTDNYAYRWCTKPLQRFAQREVARARRRGDLADPKTLACTDCGNPAREYDHRDYRKPLEVEPVCRRCNLKRGPALPYRLESTTNR